MASITPIDQQLASFNQFTQSPIVDVRSTNDFERSHLAGASNFPLASIIKRMHELPSRARSIRLCGINEQLQAANGLIAAKGYQVDSLIEWNEELAGYLAQKELLQSGSFSPRLWSPAPLVEEFQHLYGPSAKAGSSLDIGCGAGRDAVYLAMQGWQVLATDYLPGALQKTSALAANNKVDVTTWLIDLEKESSKLSELAGQFSLVLVVRYLHRPLLPIIKQLICPGGFLVYQTFMRGCEQFGSPKNPRFLLQPGELAKQFSDFEILLDRVERLADGRPTNCFIAQKKQ